MSFPRAVNASLAATVRRVAVHESGHCVANCLLTAGVRRAAVVVEGPAGAERVHGYVEARRVVPWMAIGWASGWVAAVAFGADPVEAAAEAEYDREKTRVTSRQFPQILGLDFAAATRRARNLLGPHRAAIDSVADLLTAAALAGEGVDGGVIEGVVATTTRGIVVDPSLQVG